MIVDLFCGVGGASLGMQQALGRHIDFSCDIDPEPLSVHAANFSGAHHHLGDVARIDLQPFITRGVDVLWASPPCPDFSRQNSGRQDPTRRELASELLVWAEQVRPKVMFMENVEQFKHWGPYSPRTGRTAANYEGDSFRRFILKLRQLGYMVEYRILSADDYGVPTIRRRLYLIAKFGGRDIRWPVPLAADSLQRRDLSDCIEWDTLGNHAFNRFRPLGAATQARVRHGLAAMEADPLGNDARGFLVPVNNSGTEGQSRSLNLPCLTLTAAPKGGSFAVVIVKDGEPYFRMLTPRENYRLQGFPDTFIHDLMADGSPVSVTAAIRGAGNAVCPPMAKQLVALNAE